MRPFSLFFILFFPLFFSACIGKDSYKPIAKLDKSIWEMNQSELEDAVRHWQELYVEHPDNKDVGLGFAAALRSTNQNDQALAVMQQMAIKHPEDQQVLSAYAKALVGAGQLRKALDTIERAQTPDNPDWRLYSAKGIVLDQLAQSEQARVQYEKALNLQPNAPSVLSNLGMSYLLTGDLVRAESHLRTAAEHPNAESQIRQNLALVLGLQGKFDEAQRVVSAELPTQQVEDNMEYLRAMLASQDSWQRVKKKG